MEEAVISGVRRLLTVLFLFVSLVAWGQYTATVIKENGYTSYVSTTLKQPLYVVYKLYKGGGGCAREEEHYSFKATPGMLGSTAYSGSGYHKGHMANAEDFGTKCEYTFRYSNCMPQTPTLNLGIWKKVETNIRKDSQWKRLLVVCGGTYSQVSKKGDLTIPKYYWKIVIEEGTNKVIYCLKFPNDKSNKVFNTTLPDLKKELGYVLTY